MTRSEVATEAFTVGQRIAGPLLGIPFFIGLLLLHGNNRALLVLAMVYVACVVFPVASCVSSAMAVLVAPAGQEQAYAKATAVWYAAVLFALVVLFTSMQLYAFWPFASARQLLQASIGQSTQPVISIMLGGIILVPGFAALGYVVGCHGRRYPSRFIARLLKLCWRLSKKDLLINPAI